ncbi:hypothetical protein EDF58_101591 [Novosphingobium sp. PhB57]|uniref:hypothetical protein n=1 Tax=Novosphingobium sp. PhB57 TaxID=2485107 RepID=UPI001053CCC1|nr:hypothetical protein [Novosphingobium sp. PhB57]TCU61277.1 hypothetical protein EDF58_101591 [Novosphingobium sp. PhB57]
MPVYSVTGPDGNTYKVRAPENADQSKIMAWVQDKVSKSRQAAKPSFLDNAHGALTSFLDGVVPGAGGVASGIANAWNFNGSPIKDFKEGRRAAERHQERFKQDHPVLNAGATGAGFVGGMFVPVTKVGLAARGAEVAAQGARGAEVASQAAKVGLGRRALNSGANGALYGTAGGALSSHADSAGGVLQDAARGGLTGAAVAGSLPYAGRLVSPLAAPIASAAGRKVAPALAAAGRALPGRTGKGLERSAQALSRPAADTRASRYIGGKLEQADMDPAALMTELNRRQSMGVPAAPADTHELLRDAYGSAARRPGPATAAVRRSIDARQREMSARVSGHIGETLGPVTNVERQSEALRQEAAAAARPLYDISDAQPIPLVRELRELFETPSGREAMQIAGRELLDRRVPLSQMGLVQGSDGAFSLGDAPTMPFYDHMKSVLDEGVFNGEKYGVPVEASRFGKGAREIRQDLLRIMDGDGSGPRINAPGQASEEIAGQAAGAPSLGAPAQAALPDSSSLGLPSPPPHVGRALDAPPQNALVPYEAPGVPGAYGAELPVPYEAPGGLGAHGAEVPAIPQGGEAFSARQPFDEGTRLNPEAGPKARKPRRSRPGSAIPDNGLNPYWKPARDAYAGPTQNRKALELGDQMAKDSATDAANRMENMTTGSQRDFFRLGHRTGLSQDVRGLGDYGNAARRVDGNLDARDAISYVHGGEAADNLFNRLAAEHEGYQTFAAVRGNSMTAGREASDEIARQEQSLADTGRGLWAAAQGRGIDAARHFGSAFSGEPALTNRVNELTAEGLGNTDLAGVRQMLGNVRRTRVMDRAADQRADTASAQFAKTVGSRTGAGVATQNNEVLLGYRERPDGGFEAVYGPMWAEPDEDLIPADL